MTDVAIEGVGGTIPRRRPSKLTLRRLFASGVAGFLTLAAATYGYDWWTVGRFIESTDDAYIGGDVTPISPHVAGFVAKIFVADNDYVHAGQLLIRLDDRDFRAAYDRATAIVEQREATLASLEAREQSQQSMIRQAKADVDAKAAEATFAGEDEARYRILAANGAGSRQNAEKAEALDRSARSSVTSSEAGVEAAERQLSALDAEVVETSASVAEARADFDAARFNLGYTDIRSPIDGYVANRAAETGAYVSSGSYLVTIVPAHDLWIDANFKEDQLGRIAPGQSVSVIADILPGHIFSGHVASLAREQEAIFSVIPPENATGNFTKIVQRVPVRIILDADDPLAQSLRPGLSITARVDTRSGNGSR